MEKKKNGQVIAIVALSFAILFMSIGFANYSENLNITGTATVKASKWSVHFDKDSYSESDNSVTATSKSIQDLTVTYAATLTKPGDFYEFSVDVVNDGTFDATLSSISLTSLTAAQSKYLEYSVKYGDNTYITSSDSLSIALDADADETVVVRVSYKQPDSSADLPTDNVDVSLTTTLGYVQKVS